MILNNNLILFYRIYISAAKRLAVPSAMSTLTTPAEIYAMASVRSIGVVGLKMYILTKCDNAPADFPVN